MIKRETYLEKLKSSMWDENIKVITAFRRSGKSTLLYELFYDYLLSSGIEKENSLFIEIKLPYVKW